MDRIKKGVNGGWMCYKIVIKDYKIVTFIPLVSGV